MTCSSGLLSVHSCAFGFTLYYHSKCNDLCFISLLSLLCPFSNLRNPRSVLLINLCILLEPAEMQQRSSYCIPDPSEPWICTAAILFPFYSLFSFKILFALSTTTILTFETEISAVTFFWVIIVSIFITYRNSFYVEREPFSPIHIYYAVLIYTVIKQQMKFNNLLTQKVSDRAWYLQHIVSSLIHFIFCILYDYVQALTLISNGRTPLGEQTIPLLNNK